MRTRSFNSPAEFESASLAFLRRDVVMNQLVLGVTEAARTTPDRYKHGAWFLGALDDSDSVIGALVQTPPYSPLISVMTDDAARALGAAFAREFPDERAVFGEERSASAFMRGMFGEDAAFEREQHSGVFVLRHVNDCARCEGRARAADPSDAPLLQRWMQEFSAEAMARDPAPDAHAGERLAASGRCFIWEDAKGEPVCFANNPRRLEGYWSVGPVYTPRNRRGAGFATALVEWWSRHALASGARACTLLTDLSNPVSNRIYERIGYVRTGTLAKLRRS